MLGKKKKTKRVDFSEEEDFEEESEDEQEDDEEEDDEEPEQKSKSSEKKPEKKQEITPSELLDLAQGNFFRGQELLLTFRKITGL